MRKWMWYFEQCSSEQIGTGFLPFLITHHLTWTQLVWSRLGTIKLRPQWPQPSPHLVICHISFTPWNLAKNPKRTENKHPKCCCRVHAQELTSFLWGGSPVCVQGPLALIFHTILTDWWQHLAENIRGTFALYLCYITHSYSTSLSLEFSSVKVVMPALTGWLWGLHDAMHTQVKKWK